MCAATAEKSKHTNRLAGETSPYLLQHAHNPVDWYPWGEEALARAMDEDRPIFLSIGYAACHWCHVMEHESFENDKIAALLNEKFVCIKVDREERPDLDEIYMQAVIAFTGHGGWPMSIWLTPEQKPFAGGTYFPPDDRLGRPGFARVLKTIADEYRHNRRAVNDTAEQITEQLRQSVVAASRSSVALQSRPPDNLLAEATRQLLGQFDSAYGGFGPAPKFPPSMSIQVLLRRYAESGDVDALHAAEFTLSQMAGGGMYDQIGGGFHRYSTDREWLLPHFEKMLYDNALLAQAYLSAHRLTKNGFTRRIAAEILDYVSREMQSPEGGYYSSTDADSEGEEGKFFVWTPEEVREVVGADDAQVVCEYYDITEAGNFVEEGTRRTNGRSIPRVRRQLDEYAADVQEILTRSRAKLYAARQRRVPPALDDKVLTAWNGLMISAMACGAQTLGRGIGAGRYRESAVRAADFVLTKLRTEGGQLLRTYRDGTAKLNAYLEDYAFLIAGLLDLYELTFESKWLGEARALSGVLARHFWDEQGQGYFFTGDDHEELIARRKEMHDGAIPSGNSVQALNLIRIGLLTGDASCLERAHEIIGLVGQALTRYPSAFANLVSAAAFLHDGGREVAIAGDPDEAAVQSLLKVVREGFYPYTVVALAPAGLSGLERTALDTAVPLLKGKEPIDGKPAAYVCKNFACQAPVTDAAALAEQLA